MRKLIYTIALAIGLITGTSAIAQSGLSVNTFPVKVTSGTVTATTMGAGNSSVVKLACVSNSGGLVSVTIPSYYCCGSILMMAIVPGSGAAQPTTLFDLTMGCFGTDDVFSTQGADLSNTVPKVFWTSISDQSANAMPFTLGAVDPVLIGQHCGDSKSFTVYILLRTSK